MVCAFKAINREVEFFRRFRGGEAMMDGSNGMKTCNRGCLLRTSCHRPITSQDEKKNGPKGG